MGRRGTALRLTLALSGAAFFGDAMLRDAVEEPPPHVVIDMEGLYERARLLPPQGAPLSPRLVTRTDAGLAAPGPGGEVGRIRDPECVRRCLLHTLTMGLSTSTLGCLVYDVLSSTVVTPASFCRSLLACGASSCASSVLLVWHCLANCAFVDALPRRPFDI